MFWEAIMNLKFFETFFCGEVETQLEAWLSNKDTNCESWSVMGKILTQEVTGFKKLLILTNGYRA